MIPSHVIQINLFSSVCKNVCETSMVSEIHVANIHYNLIFNADGDRLK